MNMDELQQAVARHYRNCGYDKASVQTLVLGLAEEVGELAQAVLLTQCTDYTPSAHKVELIKDMDISHEVGDCITYLMGICNVLDIQPFFYSWAFTDGQEDNR